MPLLGINRRCEVADVLIVRADRSEPLVVLPLALAIEVAAIADKNFKEFLHEQE